MSGKGVHAAGTVTMRQGPRGDQVLLVHRPRYDDWSLPKGKLETDEYLAAAAVRETDEESAVKVGLGMPIQRIEYPIKAGTKYVSYWQGRVLDVKRHKPDSEVDKIAWLGLKAAAKRLSYGTERGVLEQALDLPPTTAFVVVRHGKAMERKNFSGKDRLRPLTTRGRRQASQLSPLLAAYGVRELASSSSTRCTSTLAPFAKHERLDVQTWATLSEEQAEYNPDGVRTLMQRLIERVTSSGVPLAVCGHRPVLPMMLEALGVPDRAMLTGAALVVHLAADGEPVAVETHKPRS